MRDEIISLSAVFIAMGMVFGSVVVHGFQGVRGPGNGMIVTDDSPGPWYAVDETNQPGVETWASSEADWVADTPESTLINDTIMDIWDVNCLTIETIRRLCESGRVCEVIGHRWVETTIWPKPDPVQSRYGTYELIPPIGVKRTCDICGKTQTQDYIEAHWTEWK